MPGRPKSNTLYRKKGKKTWLFYKPGFGVVDTGKVDRFLAEQDLQRATIVPHETDEVKQVLASISAHHPFPIETPKPTPAESPSTPNNPTPQGIPLDSMRSGGASTPEPAPQKISKTMGEIARRLTPDKREQIMGLLGTGLARINALVVDLGANFLGRRLPSDYIIRDKDLELLKLGYDLLIEEIFESLQPKWWHVVIAGNVLFIVTLIPNLEKKPKKFAGGTAPPAEIDPAQGTAA